jgi:hypothetical protein
MTRSTGGNGPGALPSPVLTMPTPSGAVTSKGGAAPSSSSSSSVIRTVLTPASSRARTTAIVSSIRCPRRVGVTIAPVAPSVVATSAARFAISSF